jgi:transcription-repair coupling factor (superfamily II helicase)
MLRCWKFIYSIAVFTIVFSMPQSALAISNSNHSIDKNVRLVQNNDEMDSRIREAEAKDKANAIAVKNFKFPKLECRLPDIPSEHKTREMKREEIMALRENLEGYRKCVDEAKIKEYESVKNLIANGLKGIYKESDKKISFSVTKNVAKQVGNLFAQANDAYAARFASHEVAKAKFNERVQTWNANQKFQEEFEKKQMEDRGSSLNQNTEDEWEELVYKHE